MPARLGKGMNQLPYGSYRDERWGRGTIVNTVTPQAWSARAINLPEHSDNPVHTDDGARAAGYPAAIVAGTSVYAFLTHPPAAAWGVDWVGGGGGELKLRAPVFDNDLVDCVPTDTPEGLTITASVDDEAKATFAVDRHAAPLPARSGEDLEPLVLMMDHHWAGYGTRSGDDLALYADEGIVHPAAWPSVANRVFMTYLIDGPWVHTRSRIVHRDVVALGTPAVITSTVVDRFETRAGERAIVDVRVVVDDAVAVEIEHEALVRLR